MPDAKQLAEVALLYKNVGDGIDINAANESLISTLQGFQLEADDALSIIDKFNEVSNNFAISSGGIGEGLQRSAAAFNAANTSLSQSIALITATNEVVQDPDAVGNMWTTVSARIRGAKSELESMGEDTEDMVESTSKLRDLVKGISGVDIMLDDNTFKDIYTIVTQIGEKWDDINDIDQAALLEALAGKRQANRLAAALSNIDHLKAAYETAENSAGSAMREQENFEQGIEYSVNQFKASLEELSYDALNSEFLKGLVDTGTDVIGILDTIIDKFGLLQTALVALGTVYGSQKLGLFDINEKGGIGSFGLGGLLKEEKQLNIDKYGYNSLIKSLKENSEFKIADALSSESFTQGMSSQAIESIRNIGLQCATSEEQIMALEDGFKKLSTSGKGLSKILETTLNSVLNGLASMGISALISMAVTGVGKLINSNKELAQSVQEIGSKYSEQSSQLSDYSNKIIKLKTVMSDSSSTTEEVKNATSELYTIQNDLISTYGAYYEGIDLVNGGLEEQLALLQGIDKENAEKALSDINAIKSNKVKGVNFATNYLLGLIPGVGAGANIATSKKFFESLFGQNRSIKESFSDAFFNSDILGGNLGTDVIGNTEKQINDLMNKYEASFKTTNETVLRLARNFEDAFDVSDGVIKAKGSVYEVNDAVIQLKTQMRELGIVDEQVFNSLDTMASETSDRIKVYGDSYSSIIEATVKTSDDLYKRYSELTKIHNDYLEAQNEGDTEKVAELGQAYQDAFADISSSGIKDEYVDFFRTLYIDMQQYISTWEFEARVLPVIEGSAETQQFIQQNSSDELITKYNQWAQDRQVNKKVGRSKNRNNESDYFYDIEKAAAAAGKTVEQFIVLTKSMPKYTDTMQHVRELMGDNFTEDFEKELEGKDLTALVDIEPKTDGLSYTKKEIEDLLSPLELETDINYNANRDTADEFAELEKVLSPFDTAYQISVGNDSDRGDMLLKASEINAVVEAMGSLADKEPEFETALRKWQNTMMSGVTGEEAQVAYDDLLSAYLAYSGTLDNLIDENKDWAKSQLEELGIADRLIDKNGDIINLDKAELLSMNALNKSTVRFNASLKKLDDTLGKYYKTLKEGSKGSDDYKTSLKEIKSATQELFSYTGKNGEVISPELSDEFILENLENIREAAGGSIEALNELRAAAAQEIVAHMEIHVPSGAEDYVRNEINNLVTDLQSQMHDLEIGASINTLPAFQALKELENANAITAANVNAILASMGAAAKISYTTATITMPDYGSTAGMTDQERGIAYTSGKAHVGTKQVTIQVPNINYVNTGGSAHYSGPSAPSSSSGGGGGGGGGNGGGNSSEQSYDWVETAIQRLEREISNLDKVVNSTYENWSKRNKNLVKEIKKVTDEIKAQKDAAEIYKKKGEEVAGRYVKSDKNKNGLDQNVINEYIRKIWNGEINKDNINKSLETIKGNEQLVKFIQEYFEWYEKYLAAMDKQYDLEQDRYSLIEKGFNLVKAEFEKVIEKITDGYSFVDKRINRIQEHGYFVNDEYYGKQIDYKKSEKIKMEEELDALRKYLKENASSMDPNSEAYQDLLKQIRDLELSIEDAATDIVVLEKTIKEAAWERFSWLEDRITKVVDESDFMIEMIGQDKLYDRDTGLFNNKAWATAGLYKTKYDVYNQQAKDYEAEIKRFQGVMDKNSKDDIEHLEELNDQWQEQLKNIKDCEDAIVNLVQEGINEYLSKLQEAIDDYKKLLQNAKSLYEWQNTIDEKTENIARLRKQLSVYGGDDSEENRANLQRLNQQLAEAEKDLKETEWDHYIQETESFLDEMYSDMEEFLNKYLEDIDLVVNDVFNGIEIHGTEIKDTINAEATDIGYKLQAIDDVFKTGTQDITSVLREIKKAVENIQYTKATGEKVEDESPKTKDEGQGVIKNTNGNVRRLYNSNTGEHFYTTDDNEARKLVLNGWTDEGSAWGQSEKKDGVPVYRFYNPNTGDHFYSISDKEKATLVKAGWTYEGVSFYSAKKDTKGAQPVYRLYNPNAKNGVGSHHYTLNTAERDNLIKAGWKDEGIGWYALPINTQKKNKLKKDIERINNKIYANKGKISEYATGSEYIDKDQLAWTQDGGGEIIYRKKDGAILTPLNRGDKVYTNEMSQRLWEIASTTPQSLINNNTVPAVSNLSTTVNQNNSINITLPNVTNYEQFKSALQKDSKFEGFIKEITFGQALGYNSLKKYSY